MLVILTKPLAPNATATGAKTENLCSNYRIRALVHARDDQVIQQALIANAFMSTANIPTSVYSFEETGHE